MNKNALKKLFRSSINYTDFNIYYFEDILHHEPVNTNKAKG